MAIICDFCIRLFTQAMHVLVVYVGGAVQPGGGGGGGEGGL